MNKTGDALVNGMKHINFPSWKLEMTTQFEKYKKTFDAYIEDGAEKNPWSYFLDLIAMHWGYYGDLDIYIDQFETRFKQKLQSFQTRKDIDAFVREIGDSKDARDKRIKELRQKYEVISI